MIGVPPSQRGFVSRNVVLSVGFALAVASLAAFEQPAIVPVLSPGLHTETLRRANAPAINYTISGPPDSGLALVPLVLALHYGGEPFDGSGRGVVELLVGPALAELGAVIVAPDALVAGWDSRVNEEAGMFLLDAVRRSYRVDAKRAVVTGFSMGGMGTWHYAAKYPDQFCAAVPVAGRPPALSDRWRVPIFAVSSRRDIVVPMAPTEQAIASLKKQGMNAEMVILDAPTHFQTSGHVEGLRRAVPWLKAACR